MFALSRLTGWSQYNESVVFSDGTISISTSTTKKTAKKKWVWNVWINTYENTIFNGMNIQLNQLFWGSLGTRVLTHPQIASAQVDWCWLEPPDHAHGLPPGPAPLGALQSVAAATEAVAAALSWAAGGKGSEESAGVTWPKRDRYVYIYVYIYIYYKYIYIYYFTSSDPHNGISRHIKAYQGILRHKFWHVVLHIFWHFT